ncbi:MAG: HAMP domain-containing sensor histidine kinase [Reyranellaceae bacterium]
MGAGWGRVFRRLVGSLTLKLTILIGIFIALPVVLYGRFESADRQTRELVTRAIQDRSALIAGALGPTLRELDLSNAASLNADLARYGSDETTLKLLFQPAKGEQAGQFYYVASAPQIQAEGISAELDELRHRGILARLSSACTIGQSDQIRYQQASGAVELLTSIIPIRGVAGCWVLTTTHSTADFLRTSIGRPYWQTEEIRAAAAIYIALALLAVLVAVSIRLGLRRFRDVAAEIGAGRIGDDAFAQRNVVPELSSVARDFDRLVLALKQASRQIRQSAEDKAHSFKTPLAAIRSALEPVRRTVAPDDRRARRALEIIDSALGRLFDLVVAAQRQEIGTADLIGAPRVPVDLTRLVEAVTGDLVEMVDEHGIHLATKLDQHVVVRAGQGMLEAVVHSVLENAVSFSPPGSTILVSLAAGGSTVELSIADEGPGVDATVIAHIFDRSFSSRPRGAPSRSGEHAGLGLWIARSTIEALGGRIDAANRPRGGLVVTITLPL